MGTIPKTTGHPLRVILVSATFAVGLVVGGPPAAAEMSGVDSARDQAAKVGGAPPVLAVTVAAMADTVPPETIITSGPPEFTTNRTRARFAWTGSDNVTPTESLTYAFQLVGLDPAFSPFGSATTTSYFNLPAGTYTFLVKARDQVGNVDPLDASRSFHVTDLSGLTPFTDPFVVSSLQGSVQVIVEGTSVAGAPGLVLPTWAEIRTGADGRVEGACESVEGPPGAPPTYSPAFIVGSNSNVLLQASCANAMLSGWFDVTRGEFEVLKESYRALPLGVRSPVSSASGFGRFTTTYSQTGRTGTATFAVHNGLVFVGNRNVPTEQTVQVHTGQTVQTTGQVPELVAAVLPSSRSVQVGTTATAFATIINAGTLSTIVCRVESLTPVPAAFSFSATDAATNEAVTFVAPNTPVEIAPGEAKSFVFALRPTAPIPPTELELGFTCGGTSAPSISGVNTLTFSAAEAPAPDIVAVAATVDDTGVVVIPAAPGIGAFAVAISNLGAAGTIAVSPDTGAASLPVVITVCQQNPAGGCVEAAAPSVVLPVPASATATFAVFVVSSGSVPFDPAHHRVFVRFTDGAGVTRGSTSVAVRTP